MIERIHMMRKPMYIVVIILVLLGCHTDAGDLFIVAHKGASRDAPENTIPAFELAWKQGADAIEGDFHLTQDGEIVCIHDTTTREVAGEDLVVAESTLHELKQLDVGAWFGRQWGGTCIPTLAEVIQTVPEGKTLFLEVKCGPEIIPKLFEELGASGLAVHQVVITSFNAEVIATVEHNAPALKTLLLVGFRQDQQSGEIIPSPDDVLQALHLLQTDGVSTNAHPVVNEPFVHQILDAGYEYHVWTIDQGKTAKKFQAWGARSITTNVPGRFKKKSRQ